MKPTRLIFISILLCVTLCTNAEVITGRCGENANWSFDSETGKLTITGSGRIGYGYGMFTDIPFTSLEIGNQITSIGFNTFDNCRSLTSVSIPNSVTSIEFGAFSYCTSLTSVVIPNSVTDIESGTFYYCISLTSVVIPNSVTSIGERGVAHGAFENCISLTNIVIPNSVTYIGRYSFKGCRSLESITIPNSVEKIGRDALQECSNLRTIVFGKSVDLEYDFEEILSDIPLKEFYVSWNKPPRKPKEFFNNASLCYQAVLYVPYGCTSAYRVSDWGYFSEIREWSGLQDVEATDISLNINSKTLTVGYGLTLKASIQPDECSKTVNWSSSNPSVADVSSNGYVTAFSAGSSTITATTSNGLTATCKINVNAAKQGQNVSDVQKRITSIDNLISKTLGKLK